MPGDIPSGYRRAIKSGVILFVVALAAWGVAMLNHLYDFPPWLGVVTFAFGALAIIGGIGSLFVAYVLLNRSFKE